MSRPEQPRLETATAAPLAVVRATTTWAEFGWKPMLDQVWAFLATVRDELRPGHNVMVYRDPAPGAPAGAEVEVEVGVQVASDFPPAGNVVPSVVPGGRAAVAVHDGPPERIGAAHDAVRAWCAEHGHALSGVRWEEYGDPDEEGRFTVTVYWQLAPDQPVPASPV